VAAGVSLVPQGRGTFAKLSVDDNLHVGAAKRRDRQGIKEDLARWYEVFPVLASRRKQMAGTLSGGEQQMLAVARALMSRPRLLLCDEPSLGLAPLIVREVFNVLQRVNTEQQMAMLIVEQNAEIALGIASRAYLLEAGEVVSEGTAESLREKRRCPPRVPGLLGAPVQVFLERLFDGISNGAIYAALALALVMVFRGTGTINFAQGEMALFTTYIAWGSPPRTYLWCCACSSPQLLASLSGR